MNSIKTVSKNKPEDGNKEYLDAIIAIGELERTNEKKYIDLMTTQMTGFIGKSEGDSSWMKNHLTAFIGKSDDISWLETIRDFANLKLSANLREGKHQTNKNGHTDCYAR